MMTRIRLRLGKFAVLMAVVALVASRSHAQPPIGRGPLLREAVELSEAPESPMASPAVAPMLVLRQQRYPHYNQNYFYNGQARQILLSNPAGPGQKNTTTTNVAVYAARIYDVNGPVVALVDSWLDRRGHVHYSRVLEAQLRFNAKCSGRKRCDLTVGETGIQDKGTLLIALVSLEWRLEALSARFAQGCFDVQGTSCDGAPWPNDRFRFWKSKIDDIAPLLDKYKREIQQLPISVPARPASFQDWNDFTRGEFECGGLKDIPFPGRKSGIEGPLFSPQNDSEDEDAVRESVNDLALAPHIFEAWKSAEQNATDAVIAAERAGDDL